MTAFSRSICYRRCQLASDYNSLSGARRYECRGSNPRSITIIEISLLTLRFYRNIGLTTCSGCTPLPRCLSVSSCYFVQILLRVGVLDTSWLQNASEKGSLFPLSGFYFVLPPASPPSRRNLSRETHQHRPAFGGV